MSDRIEAQSDSPVIVPESVVRRLVDHVERAHPLVAQAEVTQWEHRLQDGVAPVVSFVMPVHDQEGVIFENLVALTACATERHEVLLVLDGCTDDTLSQVTKWIAGRQGEPGLTVRIVVSVTDRGIFETSSDALAMSGSTADFVVEVQADIHMEEVGFDTRLISALADNPDVFAVSGRGIHQFSLVRRPRSLRGRLAAKLNHATAEFLRRRVVARSRGFRPSKLGFRLTGQAGRLGSAINLAQGEGSSTLFVGGTVIRGPLAFAKADYDRLGGLDTERFFLGNDDHDLLMRAHRTLNRTGAYLPIGFTSPLEDGSTRKPRPPSVEAEFRRMRSEFARAADGSALNTGDLPFPRRSTRRLVSVEPTADMEA